MKMTLLEMTQSIMGSLNEDEINSIGDTQTALDVSEIIRESYYQIITQQHWDFLKVTFNLNGLSDVNRPTVLTVPTEVSKISSINIVDTKGKMTEVKFEEPEVFFKKAYALNSNQSGGIKEVIDGNIRYKVLTNRLPITWTSIDGNRVYFDSFDNKTTSSILPSTTLCFGYRTPTWLQQDDFIPELQGENFPYLLAEAKSLAFVQIAQKSNPKAEQYARRGRYKAIQSEGNLAKEIPLPNYGRR